MPEVNKQKRVAVAPRFIFPWANTQTGLMSAQGKIKNATTVAFFCLY
jgi:hypothetical protein